MDPIRSGSDLADVALTLAPSGIGEMFERAEAIPNVIHLEISEPGCPPPDHVREALIEAVERGVSSYTPTAGPRPEDVESALGAGAKALILNSPANPTGCVIDRRNLEEILAAAVRRDVWVISDEVYDALTIDGPPPSAAALGDPERVVSVFSFSKTYAMTGWRLGYVVAPKDVAVSVAQTHQATVTCASSPIQRGRTRRPRRAAAIRRRASRDDAGSAGPRVVTLRESGLAFGAAGRDYVRISLGASVEALDGGVAGIADLVRSRG